MSSRKRYSVEYCHISRFLCTFIKRRLNRARRIAEVSRSLSKINDCHSRPTANCTVSVCNSFEVLNVTFRSRRLWILSPETAESRQRELWNGNEMVNQWIWVFKKNLTQITYQVHPVINSSLSHQYSYFWRTCDESFNTNWFFLFVSFQTRFAS